MKAYYQTPIGLIELTGNETGLETCSFLKKSRPDISPDEIKANLTAAPEPLVAAWQQLDEYFKGIRREFSLLLRLEGTSFQKKVWNELQKIPYGQTRSYGQVASACGRPGAARAVGRANHDNPLVIIIPCHRVIGADGRLVGFGAGLWRKSWLLSHEKKICGHWSQSMRHLK
ncbi:MAG TPA: methylated-DNA--[protein]-cysteine S-methyltransferase [Candidatus Saccharicenans sp.]|nr:methylated-DNA--[protein]-cysteine S-methyltransferase [Candidatus Saccharicenans sp.]HNT01900.1 methylated-DNA--[protein]-cysteine S-methyltransferase [Candidatus Saccharicenans sp.]